MGFTVPSIASLHSVSTSAYVRNHPAELYLCSFPTGSSIWKTIQSARMRNPVLFKTLSYGDLETGRVREDEVRETQHPAQCQLGSVYQCWRILSGTECFTSDRISNSTWQALARDNKTLNCMLQSSTITAHFFFWPGSRKYSSP